MPEDDPQYSSVDKFIEATGGDPPADSGRRLVVRSKGMELEIPLDEIFIGGERFTRDSEPRHGARKARTFLCGNCGDRIPMSDDHIENHHNAQRHKMVCSKFNQAQLEHEQLLALDRADRERLLAAAPVATPAALPVEIAAPTRWQRFRSRFQSFVFRYIFRMK